MGDVFVAVIAAAVIVVALIAAQILAWLARRQRAASDEFDYLQAGYQFQRVSDRFVIDTRVTTYTGQFRGMTCDIEIGVGTGVQYARVDFLFEREVPLGLRISSEHEEGVFTRVMRMREVQIGLQQFDSQFILLSRDENRLKEILDHDVRRMLMSLRKEVADVRLNDDGLHLNLTGAVSREHLIAILEEGSQLASHVFRRGEDLLVEQAKMSEEKRSPAFTPVPGTLKAVSNEAEPKL